MNGGSQIRFIKLHQLFMRKFPGQRMVKKRAGVNSGVNKSKVLKESPANTQRKRGSVVYDYR
jgi:hypothetical protein